MPVKSLYNSGFEMKCTIHFSTPIERYRSIRNYGSADAVWTRQKPVPLSDTPMVITKVRDNPTVYQNRRPDGVLWEGFLGFVYPSDDLLQRTLSDDGTGAFNRALDGFSEFTFGESLVEARKTASMMLKRGRQLDAIGFALLRGDRKALERLFGMGIKNTTWKDLAKMPASRRLAEGYNEVSYGWMPALQAISDGARAYIRGLGGRGETRTRHRGGGNRIGADSDWSNLPAPQGAGTVSGTISNPLLANANMLGLLNVPKEIWNYVPYSFVFDWGIPIGTYLGGLTATAGLTDVRASRTSVRRREKYMPNRGGAVLDYEEIIDRQPVVARPTIAGLAHGSAVTFGKVVSTYALSRTLLSR